MKYKYLSTLLFAFTLALASPISITQSSDVNGDNILDVQLSEASAMQSANNTFNKSSGTTNTQKKVEGVKFTPHCNAWPTTWLAGCLTPSFIALGGAALAISGTTFDFFMALTLDTSLLSAPYIDLVWAEMRNLANMTFILGIIVVALLMITGADQFSGNLNWKVLARRLIIVALLVNFSLFFSRVVIDAGNITGKFFYQQIINTTGLTVDHAQQGLASKILLAPATVGSDLITARQRNFSPYQISEKIIQPMRLDELLGGRVLNELSANGKHQGFLFMFNIVFIVIALAGAYSFFVSGFYFLTRTVWLIILSIISPLAFVAYFIPFTEHYWKSWWKDLFNKSFCVAVYLFLIFLLVVIMSSGFASGITAHTAGDLVIKTDTQSANDVSNFFVQRSIRIAVLMMLVFGVLNNANRKAREMCEGADGGLGGMLLKTTVGAAALTGGFAGRATIGRLGRRLTKSETVGNMATSKNAAFRMLGNTLYSGGEAANKAKFGMDKGYGDKLVEQSKLRSDRADTLAGLRKDDIKKDVEAAARNKIRNKELARLGKLTSTDPAYEKMHAEAVKNLRAGGAVLTPATAEAQVKAEMEKLIAKQASSAADGATLKQKNVDKEIAKRTKQQAKDLLDAGKGSAVDWALAGGVAAYDEAAASYKVFDEGDQRKDREKASLIAEKARMATAHQLKSNTMDSEVDKMSDLISVVTDDNQGIMLDERTIEQLVGSGELDLSGLENVIKASMTTTSIDSDGNEQQSLDTVGYEQTMGNLMSDMQIVKDHFSSNFEEQNTRLSDAKAQHAKVNESGSTASSKEIAAAEKELKSANQAMDKTNGKIAKAVKAVGNKTTKIAKGALKAQLAQATALGTAQYDNAAEESEAAALQAKEGDSKDLDIGLALRN